MLLLFEESLRLLRHRVENASLVSCAVSSWVDISPVSLSSLLEPALLAAAIAWVINVCVCFSPRQFASKILARSFLPSKNLCSSHDFAESSRNGP